jgi:MFS family permease
MSRRWPVVAAAFASMFTVFGVAYSFGAFFDPMSREFHVDAASTSAVFSITAFLYFTLGSVTGAVADRLGPRPVLLFGTAVMAAGLLMTAWAGSIVVAYVGYGLGVGIGTACGYVPMVAVVGAWYTRGRSLAIGVAVTGIGLGTLLVPPLAAALIGRLGWRETYLVLGAAATVVLVACSVVAGRPPGIAPHANDLRLGRAVRTPQFLGMYTTGLLASFSLFIAFVHIAPFAARHGAGPVAAAALIGAIGIGSTAGRVAFGWVAERLGSVRAFQLSVLVLGLSFAVWLAVPQYPGLFAFAVALGLGYGGWVALSPSVIADLFGAQGMGGTVGFLYTSAGVGALLGPLAAGFIVDRSGSYTVAVVAALVLGLLAIGPILPLRPRVVESV